MDIIGGTIHITGCYYQSSSRCLFRKNLISYILHIMWNERTGKEISKRDHIKDTQRSRGLHWLATPENTNEVFCILSAIKLECNLFKWRVRKRRVIKYKVVFTSEPLRKKKNNRLTRPHDAHARFRDLRSRPYHVCDLQKSKERRDRFVMSDLETNFNIKVQPVIPIVHTLW